MNFSDRLFSNKKVLDIVSKLNPIDIVTVLVRDASLTPRDASKVALSLIKKTEGMSSPGIETNKEFPVPASSKRGTPRFFNPEDITPIDDIDEADTFQRHQFPPDPRPEAGDWPYDDHTVQGLKPKNRSRLKSLTAGKNNVSYVFKKTPKSPPATVGMGIHAKSAPHAAGNSTPSGGSSYTRQGTPGWSSSPTGAEFDLPNEKEEDSQEEEVENELPGNEVEFLKNPNTGAGIPQFFGGRNPGRRMGFRKR